MRRRLRRPRDVYDFVENGNGDILGSVAVDDDVGIAILVP